MAEQHPLYAPPSFYLGLLSQRRQETEMAIEFFAAALRADPTHVDAINNLGAALTSLAPADRTRLAKTVGLLQLPQEENRAPEGERVVADVAALERVVADRVVAGLFRRALELEPTHRWALVNLGLHLHARGRNDEAVGVFTRALEVYPEDAEVSYNLGVAQQALGKAQDAAQSFAFALKADTQHVGAALNLAALHHRYGDTGNAIELYRKAAEKVDPDDIDMIVMLRNNLGTAFFQSGEHTLAKIEHREVLAMLEASNERLSHVQDGERGYDVYIETLVNLQRARKASCDWDGWEQHVFTVKAQVHERQLQAGHSPSLLPFDSLLLPYPVTSAWRRQIAEAHSLRYVEPPTVRGGSDEFLGDVNRAGSLEHVRQERLNVRTAERERTGVVYGDEKEATSARRGGHGERVCLNIAFVGHDFDEHPTAHMIEGVFVWQKRLTRNNGERCDFSKAGRKGGPGERPANYGMMPQTTPTEAPQCCRYLAYSYGGGGLHNRRVSQKNVGGGTSSRARESIRASASSFVDLYASGHGESVEQIRADGVDILVDLQGHTLGGRAEIAAARPAPLQVSYLVYPGTSGAPYVDYLLADRHVTPPEHAGDYTESLVLLPRTYQANHYEGLMPAGEPPTAKTTESARALLRHEQGLPADLSRAVFANFNKIDKLDPESFLLWMQVLRRVPGSVLWLLEPSAVDTEREAIRRRLREESESQGVDGRRIVWAKWVSKSEHLLRHALADLFLDTLTYGAHSTATDALAGGLPFLTLAGASFASRVGVSLLRNAGPSQSALLVAGQREYEDLAVELVCTERGRKVLRELRASLKLDYRGSNRSPADKVGGGAGRKGGKAGVDRRESALPIFDTEAITRELNQAFMLMSDVHDMWKDRHRGAPGQGDTHLPHIVLTGRNKIEPPLRA
eukprot:g12363.t1